MAQASESKIREELQKKKVRDFYLLAGEDPFKLDHYAEEIFRAGFGEGGAREIIYGDELDPASFLDQIRTPSLWDPRKWILVRHGERLSAKTWEALLPLLQEPIEKVVVVVQSSKADGRLKFFQALGKAPDRCALVKLEPAEGGEWNLWLQSFLRESGKDMDDPARQLLLQWTGSSLSELKHCVERAGLFAGGDPIIREPHVRAVAIRITQEDVFRLTGAVFSGDRAQTLRLLEALLSQGEEPLALIGLLARQYRWLLGILVHRAEGQSDTAIASSVGIYPAAGKVLFPASRRLGGKGVIKGLARLAEADHALKSSRMPKEHVMTRLMLSLTE